VGPVAESTEPAETPEAESESNDTGKE